VLFNTIGAAIGVTLFLLLKIGSNATEMKSE
jgi:hypothetical protein